MTYTKRTDIKTRAVNLRYQEYDVLIDRRTKWGNPFFEDRHGTREEVINKYREWITKGEGRHLLNDLHELKGKRLGCWCKPLPCHGDILASLAERVTRRRKQTTG